MNPIHWLEIIKPTRSVKHLSNHFILKLENKFMVFTSKPVNGLTNHYIATPNIEKKTDPQFLVEKIHTIDPIKYITKPSEKGAIFYINNKSKLDPFIDKIKKSNMELCIDKQE